MVGHGKVQDGPPNELNGKTGVYRRVGGRSRRDESAGIIGSRTGVSSGRVCLGAGGLYTKECFLTLGDVEGYGESVESQRKEDKGAHLPVGCHDGTGYTVVAWWWLRGKKGNNRSKS